jgi:hypothetical protein
MEHKGRIEYPVARGGSPGPTALTSLWVCEDCRRAAWHYPHTKIVNCCGKRSRPATREEITAGKASIDPNWAGQERTK